MYLPRKQRQALKIHILLFDFFFSYNLYNLLNFQTAFKLQDIVSKHFKTQTLFKFIRKQFY